MVDSTRSALTGALAGRSARTCLRGREASQTGRKRPRRARWRIRRRVDRGVNHLEHTTIEIKARVESSIEVVRRAHRETIVTARHVDDAAEQIRHKRRRTLESAALAASCALLAWLALDSAALALALAVGTGFEVLLAG